MAGRAHQALKDLSSLVSRRVCAHNQPKRGKRVDARHLKPRAVLQIAFANAAASTGVLGHFLEVNRRLVPLMRARVAAATLNTQQRNLRGKLEASGNDGASSQMLVLGQLWRWVRPLLSFSRRGKRRDTHKTHTHTQDETKLFATLRSAKQPDLVVGTMCQCMVQRGTVYLPAATGSDVLALPLIRPLTALPNTAAVTLHAALSTVFPGSRSSWENQVPTQRTCTWGRSECRNPCCHDQSRCLATASFC